MFRRSSGFTAATSLPRAPKKSWSAIAQEILWIMGDFLEFSSNGSSAPEVAVRFRNPERRTVQSLRLHPLLGPRYSSSNRNFKICARDRLRDLKPFKFVIL